MRFTSGLVWALLPVLFVVAYGLTCATSNGLLTFTSYSWALLALLRSLLQYELEAHYLSKSRE